MWSILMILMGAGIIGIHTAVPVRTFSDRLARGISIASGIVIVAVGLAGL